MYIEYPNNLMTSNNNVIVAQSTLTERIRLLTEEKKVVLAEIKLQTQPVKDYRAYFRIQGKINYYTKKIEANQPDKKLSKVDKYKQRLAELIETGDEKVDKTAEYKNLLFKIKYNTNDILREYHAKHNAINNIINKSADVLCC